MEYGDLKIEDNITSAEANYLIDKHAPPLLKEIPPIHLKYPISSEIDMKNIMEQQYYQALNLEEKNFYNNLNREEKDWYLEIGTTEVGEKIRKGLESSIKGLKENTEIIQSLNRKLNIFNNNINLFNI